MVTQGPVLGYGSALNNVREKEPPSHLVRGLAGAVTFQHRHYVFKGWSQATPH